MDRLGAAHKVVLGPEQSAALRGRLLKDVAAITSADDGALWAYCNLRAQNGLTATDAQAVESAFQKKVAAFAVQGGPAKAPAHHRTRGPVVSAHAAQRSASTSANGGRAKRTVQRIDKTILAFPEPRRIRDREHVRLVATQPCVVCGRVPCDAHHLRFAHNRALGRKVSDEFTVPLCRGHHREVHRHGDEASWWNGNRIDAIAIARDLWLETHQHLSVNKAAAVASSSSPPGPISEFAPPPAKPT